MVCSMKVLEISSPSFLIGSLSNHYKNPWKCSSQHFFRDFYNFPALSAIAFSFRLQFS